VSYAVQLSHSDDMTSKSKMCQRGARLRTLPVFVLNVHLRILGFVFVVLACFFLGFLTVLLIFDNNKPEGQHRKIKKNYPHNQDDSWRWEVKD
jgi:hypothetical protein